MYDSSLLQVKPGIHPELKEHTSHFEKQIYKVRDNVYQAVGWNLANTILIEGDEGIIVIDVGEGTSASRELLTEFRKISDKPIKAIVYTHFHVDHINGTKAFASAEEVKSGKVPIYAHENLMREQIYQSSLVGPILGVRTAYSFGIVLKKEDNEFMNHGIGPIANVEYSTFMAPTHTYKDELKTTVAGVEMHLYYAPGEADDETIIYFPELKTLCCGDVVHGPTLPNIHTLRGTRYRDPIQWVDSLDLCRSLKAEYLAGSHARPVIGAENVEEVLRYYRDGIQFVHDQTVRHMNKGLTPDELVEVVKLPPHLAEYKPWLREYYGTVKHGVRQIYQGLLGWFGGDPVDLDPTPPIEKALRTVKLMGGRDKVFEEAWDAYKNGDNQWAAELTTVLIRIDKEDMEARHLKAAAYKKLGYACMNTNWRNWYLMSAYELDGILDMAGMMAGVKYSLFSPDVLMSFPIKLWLKEWTTKIDPEKSLDVQLTMGFKISDTGEAYALEIRRGVVQFHPTYPEKTDADLMFTRETFETMIMGEMTFLEAMASDLVQMEGEQEIVESFFACFDIEPSPIVLSLR